jgi:hypothetical protein
MLDKLTAVDSVMAITSIIYFEPKFLIIVVFAGWLVE